MHRGISSQSVPFISSHFSQANNLPWYADFSNPSVCDVSVNVGSRYNLNGVMVQETILNFEGSAGQTACFSYSLIGGTVLNRAIKLTSLSLIHDFDHRYFCGSYQTYDTRVDPIKSDIDNGISCHCPGSAFDARFSKCEYEYRLSNTSNLTFKPIPSSDPWMRLQMCHNLETRGPSKGCFVFDQTTDYYLKLYTLWNFHPIFDLKPRTALEATFTMYEFSQSASANGTVITTFTPLLNFTIPEYDSTIIDNGNFDVSYVSSSSDKSLISDYVAVSLKDNFQDPEYIFMIPTINFDIGNGFNPEKLCSIRYKANKLDLVKWDLDDELRKAFTPTRCHSKAEGNINIGFARLESYFTPENKLSSRLNIDTTDMLPGESAVLKTQISGTYRISVRATTSTDFVSITTTNCTMLKFKYSCRNSINEEGFPCTTEISTLPANENCKVTVVATDSSSTVATFYSMGTQSHNFFINRIYTSENKTTLCAKTNPSENFCSTVQLEDVELDDDVHNTGNYTDTNFDDDKDSNIFLTAGKMLRAWIAIIVGVVGGIIGLVILYFSWPLIRMCMKRVRNKAYSIKERIKNYTVEDENLDEEMNSSRTQYTL